MKLYRVESDSLGIYAAVERDCPRDDQRRIGKPDGAWLPRVGKRFPGATSFWTEHGFKKYQSSGLFEWHESVVTNEVIVLEFESSQIDALYEDDFQVIGKIK